MTFDGFSVGNSVIFKAKSGFSSFKPTKYFYVYSVLSVFFNICKQETNKDKYIYSSFSMMKSVQFISDTQADDAEEKKTNKR